MQPLEPRLLLAAIGTQPAGALSGKIIFTSGGHGYTADNTGTGGWSTQRGLTNSMIEDFGNQEQMSAYVNYLFNAGATIVPMRPVGNQPNEVVLDNDSPGVTYTGTWSNSTGTIYYGTPGDVPYRFASTSTTETAVARYTPNIPVAGFYPVYAWAADGSNRATDQLYRVTTPGGSTEVRINHRRVGKGWVYLGTYYFDQGTAGYVEISNKSTSTSSVVIADAIRFGNGMGSIDRGGGVSGHTREDEASLYWIMASAGVGTASSVYAPNGDDNTDNVGAPIRWAAYMNNQSEGAATDRLYLSFHSNAGDGTSRGTLGLYNDPANATIHQQAWAELVSAEVTNDMVAITAPPLEFSWFNRTAHTLNRSDIDFGEIRSDSINNEMDATILEVAFHDNPTDAALLRDPRVRNWVGRAAYQATVKYFATYPSATPVNILPDRPTAVRTSVASNGNLTIWWNAPLSNGIVGGAATGYRIYTSKNGYAFDGGVAVAGGSTTSYLIPSAQLDNSVYYFRVAATNAGGESPPSEVAAARKPATPRPQVLIVNGFDRLERTQDIRINGADRVRSSYSNSFDYVVQHASAIFAAGTNVEINSAANEAVISGQVKLSDYAAVFWISGEESTADASFDSTEQALVKGYLDGGGRMLISGSEIGWDLAAQGNGPAFYSQTLHATYVADDANTYSASGAAGSIFNGISLAFDNGSQFYDVDYPDVLTPFGGATLAMNYTTGGGAAIQFRIGDENLVMLAFPFETITTAANRNAVMAAVLASFGTLTPPPLEVPDLTGGDTGTSTTDNLTEFDNTTPAKRLTFTVAGTMAGATVSILADGVEIGSATASGVSTVVLSNGGFDLLDGVHQITAMETISGLSSPPSGPLAIVVDTTPPTADIVDVSPDPHLSSVFEFPISFSEPVVGFNVPDLSLRRNGVLFQTTPFANLTTTDNRNWILKGLDGETSTCALYQLTLTANNAGIRDAAGNTMIADASDQWVAATPYLQGTDAVDVYLVRFNASANTLDVFENNPTDTPSFQIPRASTSFLDFRVSLGEDSITLDLAGAGPLEIRSGSKINELFVNSGTIDLRSIWRLKRLAVDSQASINLAAFLLFEPDPADRAGLIDFLTNLIRIGRNKGNWDGLGLMSRNSATDPRRIYGLALFQNDRGDGTPILASIAGQTADANMVVVRPALNGDVNLDSYINADDYAIVDAGLASGASGYQNGDLDYSGGRPNADDYFLIDHAFADQFSTLPSPAAPSVINLTRQKFGRRHSHHLRHVPECRMFRWQLR